MTSAPVLERAPETSIPPLLPGDRLDREEFERRWDLHPEIKGAELIDGQVYLEMTVSPNHSDGHIRMAFWAMAYASRHSEVEAHDNVTVRIGDDDLQPDVSLRVRVGGNSARTEKAIEGPPELVIEVAASSVAYDLFQKKEAYRRAGVREYLVWQLFEGRVDWWELREGEYLPLPARRGVIESRVFPGLRLPVASLLKGDVARLLAAIR